MTDVTLNSKRTGFQSFMSRIQQADGSATESSGRWTIFSPLHKCNLSI